MKRLLPIIIIAAVLLVALAGAAMLLRKPQTDASAPSLATVPPTVQSTPEQPAHYKGRIDAPIQLEEYGDYQCPPCGLFHPITGQVLAQYGDRVRFSFRNFPLPAHKFARDAAQAAEAAALQGKFWQMHDMIYEHQAEWKDAADARPIFFKYAHELGLDENRFRQDIDSSVVSMRVAQDQYLGKLHGVQGTPTLFLNGREVPFEQIMDFNKLRAVIDAALAGKS